MNDIIEELYKEMFQVNEAKQDLLKSLEKISKNKEKGYYYSIDKNNNIIQNAKLELDGFDVKVLPKNLKQRDLLSLASCNLEKIEDGFEQKDTLDLSNNKIKELPKGFKHNGALYLSNNKIKELPKGFKHNGKDLLSLKGNPIKREDLPKEMQNLDSRFLSI